MSSGSLEPLEESPGDSVHALVKAGLSAIPVFGGSFVELFDAVIKPPLEKRRDQWLDGMARELKELERQVKGFSIEALAGNEMFVTAFLHASRSALRNHQREKLEALRNAVLNVACGRWTDEDMQLMFLELVDTLTPWHLRILYFWRRLVTSEELYSRLPGTPTMRGLLEERFPELGSRSALYEPMVAELVSRGLIVFQTGWEGTSVKLNHISEFGEMFLKFIESPL